MSCLRNPLASVWVQLWEALFATPDQLKQVNSSICRSQALRELEATEERLRLMETKLEKQSEALVTEARERKIRGDISGAKKKLTEKRNVVQQLERLRSSQHVISMHLGTMQGAELNQTLMATLKASSQAIKAFAPDRNLREVEDVMFQLETEMKSASEINDALAKPIISLDGIGMDMSSSMNFDNSDLEQELQHLLDDDHLTPQAAPLFIKTVPLAISKPAAEPAAVPVAPTITATAPTTAPNPTATAPRVQTDPPVGFRVMQTIQVDDALANAC